MWHRIHRSLQRHRLYTWYFDGSHVLLDLKKKKKMHPTRGRPDGMPSVRKISEPRDPVPALILPLAHCVTSKKLLFLSGM